MSLGTYSNTSYSLGTFLHEANSFVRGTYTQAGTQVSSKIIATGNLQQLGVGLAQAVVGRYMATRACFTRRVFMDSSVGRIRADRVKKGDKLAARSEFNPNGPVEYKEVLEVLTDYARIWNLHVAGQLIETTAEHRYYVANRDDWVPTYQLQIGDLLKTRGGLLVRVEGVADSGREEEVYNCTIEDYHTYFVSAGEAYVSLWSHNAFKCGDADAPARRGSRKKDLLEQPGMQEKAPRGTNNPAVRAAIDKGDAAHTVLQEKMRAKGWSVDRADTAVTDPATGRTVYPDAITPRGRPIEIKPRTPTGIDAGRSQLDIYERATGRRGRVIYYDPNDF